MTTEQGLELACKKGYYSFPKKTNIQELAVLRELSPSTYQEHLRKAESKVMPFIVENMIIMEKMAKKMKSEFL